MAGNLNVEVILKRERRIQGDALTAFIQDELVGSSVHLGDRITNFKSNELTEYIDCIHICEYERGRIVNNGPEAMDATISAGQPLKINRFELNLYLYRLNAESPTTENLQDEEETPAANYTLLPSKMYEGLWDTLIFDSDVKNNLLQYSRTMLHYSRCGVDPQIIACNRIILLHGPPGSGKTSLCKALAHKLSIRMQSAFSKTILVEINTHSLFSKYFSESGKLVSRMFTKILEMVQMTKILVCILVDEVESLTHSRAAASHGTEPSDAIRVVNAVLTHLDLLKTYPNVLVLTTSNVSNAIDIAFIDRADLRILVSNPSVFAIYSIYHTCIEELIKKRILLGPCPKRLFEISEFINFDPSNYTVDGNKELIQLARESEGLSGRTLRKVALRVHSTLIPPDALIQVPEFVEGMIYAVQEFKKESEALNQNYVAS